jgi:molecular chaperone DnaK (HSP70)
MKAALVIGCGTFDDPEISGLRFAARDASRFGEIAKNIIGVSDDNLHVLSDKSPSTRSSVLRALTLGKRNVDGRSIETLVFYFSGHGFHTDDGEDYLVLQDTVLGALTDTALSFKTLVKHLSAWKARHIVLFLDACRTHARRHKAPTDADSKPIDVRALCPPGMITFCSCSPGQKSFEVEECQSGLFTEALVCGFSSEMRCSTVYEINNFLVRYVPGLGRRYSKPIQNPFTRVEPLEAQNLVLVREEVRRKWQGLTPFREEVRSTTVAPVRIREAAPMLAIDFGTTNSLAALFSEQDGTILLNSPDGNILVPSVVNFKSDLSYIVGEHAIAYLKTEPSATIGYVKRVLGTGESFNVHGRSISPDDVAGLIIKSLKTTAEQASGAVFEDVLASIPVNFTYHQERGLKKAFEQSGFRGIRFLPEPCASALLAAEEHKDTFRSVFKVLVIDLGGGTLDISAVEMGTGTDSWADGIVLDVVAVEGNTKLGGMDYDSAIVAYIREELKRTSVTLTEIDNAVLLPEAERAKIVLSQQATVTIVVRVAGNEEGEAREYLITLTRAAVAEAVKRLDDLVMLHIIALFQKKDDDMSWPHVVMLAGQGTKLFSLKERIKKLFPGKEIMDRYQNSAVIRGLGLYLRTLNSNGYLLLLNVYGKVLRLMCSEVIKQSSRLGTSVCRVASNADQNRDVIELVASDDVIPYSHKVKAFFLENENRMMLTIAEVVGGGSEEILGNITFERTASFSEAIDITVNIEAGYTSFIEMGSSSTDDDGPKFVIAIYERANGEYEAIDVDAMAMAGVRCVESSFPLVRRRRPQEGRNVQR